MCNPAVIPVILAVAGAGAQVYSNEQQSKFQEKVAQQNADLAAMDEADARRRGAIEEEQHRAKVWQMLGAQRAAFGARNVVSASGTPLGLLAETAEEGEFDAIRIRNNAARETFGYGVERAQSRDRARMYRRSGRADSAGTALAGAAQAYGFWKAG